MKKLCFLGEPNNWGGNEDCFLTAMSANLKWFDINCNGTGGGDKTFIPLCEKDEGK